MKVIINSSCLVQPAEPTWNGCMPLTEPDQTGVLMHVPTIYFYRPSKNWLTDKDTIITTLKTSLSKTLVHFYPLAGRVRWLAGSRLELDCNSKGVQLIEATSDTKLDDLGDFSPSPDFNYLIAQIDYTAPIEDIPLLIVQLTKFTCGGISLSYNISHAVVDGHSALHFFSEWARLARGEPLGTPPFLDRRAFRAGEPPSAQTQCHNDQFEPPPLIIGESSRENESKKETALAMLKLSKHQVEMIKNEANSTRPQENSPRAYTRYESTAAHIWRSVTKARRHLPEQPTGMGICVEVRNRMKPPLPEKFFGNAIVDVAAKGQSGEIVASPLGKTASKIREAIERVTNEYVHSAIDSVKNLDDLSGLQDIHALKNNQRPFYGNPNLGVISWIGLPLHGLDFGWGNEFSMGPGTHDGDGDSLIISSSDGDGSLVVAVCLQAECIEDFKKFFYQDINQTKSA